MTAGVFQWKGRFGPLELILGETTFAPTTISTLVADAMDVRKGDVVIDVGTGTGVLAIIAAKLGASRVLAVDNSPEVEEVGRANAEAHGVSDRIEFHQGDLFAPLDEDVEADVIIGDVSGVPDSLAAVSGWFPTGIGGGPRGSELPIRMLREAVRRCLPSRRRGSRRPRWRTPTRGRRPGADRRSRSRPARRRCCAGRRRRPAAGSPRRRR